MCGLQAGELVSDEVQNQLMVLAIADVARMISSQTPAAAAAGGGKPAAKPAGGKAKKDEPKPVQVQNYQQPACDRCCSCNIVVLSWHKVHQQHRSVSAANCMQQQVYLPCPAESCR